jgi:hypothetical protein
MSLTPEQMEQFSSRVYAAGKSAAALKESHFELAQNYRVVARSERKLQKTVAMLKGEVDSLRLQLQTVVTKVGPSTREPSWNEVPESKRSEQFTKTRLEEVMTDRMEELTVGGAGPWWCKRYAVTVTFFLSLRGCPVVFAGQPTSQCMHPVIAMILHGC